MRRTTASSSRKPSSTGLGRPGAIRRPIATGSTARAWPSSFVSTRRIDPLRPWATVARSRTHASRCRHTRRMRSSTSTRVAGSTADSRSTTSFWGLIREADQTPERVDPDWVRRQSLTFELAEKFLHRHQARGCTFEPIGVAQGWSAGSYAAAVTALQNVGYLRVALGGMVPLKTPEILRCLDAVAAVLEPGVEIHLLGVTRLESITRFGDYGVTSFDSTSPFRQAFMDADDNYYQIDGALCAVRIPQSDGNTRLRNLIGAGQLPQDEVRALEDAALAASAATPITRPASRMRSTPCAPTRNSSLAGPPARATTETTLAARPWDACDCGVCRSAGIDVVVFRGKERNKRRGFHNLEIFRARLDHRLEPQPV